MKLREEIKLLFEDRLQKFGVPILVYFDWKTPKEVSYEAVGIKDNEMNDSRRAIFKFKNKIELRVGSVLSQKGTKNFWRVVEIEDCLICDTYINFNVYAQNMIDQEG